MNCDKAFRIIVTIALLVPIAGYAQSTLSPTGPYADFLQKSGIALVSAFFGFLGNFILNQIKARNEPKKELSYEKIISKGFVADNKKIDDKVKIFYDNEETDGLYYVEFNLQNSGTSVVKKQQIRFDFGVGNSIIDSYFEPEPERELGVKRVEDSQILLNERTFSIAHLERDRDVRFRFIIDGKAEPTLTIHPFNDEGNVSVVPGRVVTEANDRYHVMSILRLFVLFNLIPPIFYIMPGGIGELAAGLIRFGLVLLMIPHLKVFVATIGGILLHFAAPSSHEFGHNVKIVHSGANSIVAGVAYGNPYYALQPSNPEHPIPVEDADGRPDANSRTE